MVLEDKVFTRSLELITSDVLIHSEDRIVILPTVELNLCRHVLCQYDKVELRSRRKKKRRKKRRRMFFPG